VPLRELSLLCGLLAVEALLDLALEVVDYLQLASVI
jgi:hypothetical protein